VFGDAVFGDASFANDEMLKLNPMISASSIDFIVAIKIILCLNDLNPF